MKIAPALSIDPSVEGQPATYTGNLALEYGDHHHLQIVRKLPDAQDTVVWVDRPRLACGPSASTARRTGAIRASCACRC